MTALTTPRYNPRHAPLATVEPADHRQVKAGHNVECPVCGKSFAAGALVDSAREFVYAYRAAKYTGPMITRRLYCDHCDHIIIRDFAVAQDGRILDPIGDYGLRNEPRVIERFLRDHPNAAGVL
jgi:hypothetical protein